MTTMMGGPEVGGGGGLLGCVLLAWAWLEGLGGVGWCAGRMPNVTA